MPKISVIIPCYNVAAYIDRCLKSIMNQTIGIEELEIICIDDASTDETWKILQKWEQTYPDNFVLFQQKKNRRQGAARNIGLKCASADWIAFVDGDDWLEQVYFEHLYMPTIKNKCDIVLCGGVRDYSEKLTYFDDNVKGMGGKRYYKANVENKKIFLKERILGEAVWGKIIRKKILLDNNIFFPENLVYEDVYWIPLLCIYATDIYFLEENLYHYYYNPFSVVCSINNDYRMDAIAIHLMKWEEYIKRNLMVQFKDELEYDLLINAIGYVWRLCKQWDDQSFYFFNLEREMMKTIVPNPEKNPYLEGISEIWNFLLKILYSSIDERGFEQIVHKVKDYLNQSGYV